MHWAYVYMKNIAKFCPPRWYRYVKIWLLAHGLLDICGDQVFGVLDWFPHHLHDMDGSQ